MRYKKTFSNGYTCISEINTRLGCKYENLATTNKVTVYTYNDYARPIDSSRIIYKNVKNDTFYLQHEPQVGKPESRKYVWFKNGEPTTEEDARNNLPKSAFEVQKSGVKRIKLENIISIGKEV